MAKLLFDNGHCHVTAEDLHGRARDAKIGVSLATVYNTLHQFTDAGLLREVVVDAGRSYFDTNTSEHHHFYFEDRHQLEDIPQGDMVVSNVPKAPPGTTVKRVDVIVRLASRG